MTCERYHHSIEAYVDGECRPDEAAALREHLHVCSTCRRRALQLSALQELVNQTLSVGTAPPDLWQRIASRLNQGQPAPAVSSALRRASWDGAHRLLAAAAVVVMLAAGSLALMLQPEVQPEEAVVRETVQDLVTFDLSRRPFDIAASDPTIVRAWFAGKVRFKLPPLKARAVGYELIGSRLCWLLGRRGGAFTYQHGERFMTLYVIQGDAVELSDGRFDPVLGKAAVRRQVANYASLVWRRGDLVFSLVSDASDEEMTRFAATVISHGEEAATRRHGVLAALPPGRDGVRDGYHPGWLVKQQLPHISETIDDQR